MKTREEIYNQVHQFVSQLTAEAGNDIPTLDIITRALLIYSANIAMVSGVSSLTFVHAAAEECLVVLERLNSASQTAPVARSLVN